jgi:hypothetical protein
MLLDEALVRDEIFELEGFEYEVNCNHFTAPGVFACCNCGASSWDVGGDDDDWVCNNCGMLDATFSCVLASSVDASGIELGKQDSKAESGDGDRLDGGEVEDMELSGYGSGAGRKYDRFCYLQTKLRDWLARKQGIDEGARDLIRVQLEGVFSKLNDNFDEIAAELEPGKKKSFPNHQLALLNVLELLDRKDLADDLKLVENRQTRKQFALYWWFFCKKLGWPFLSEDIDMLKRMRKIKI